MEHLLKPAINLLILIGFLGYKTKGPIMDFVRGRRSEIFEGLNKSKVQAEAAAAKRKEVEARLAGLEFEKAKIVAEWKEKAAIQSKAIRDASEQSRAQIKIESEQNKKVLIEQTRLAIEKGFRKTILAQAEQKIIQSLNPSVHGQFNARMLQDVSKGAQI